MAVVSTCEIYITTTGDGNSHLVHKETCEIVYDSILKNKEKTKSYWEKLMLAAKLASRNLEKGGNMDKGKGKEESVIEREIRMQREREEALANERQAALKLTKYNEEGLHSIPTTDEGNFSESGSEEKEHSLDSSNDADDGFIHQRTLSYESMSSGHSSGSETICRRRSVVRPLDEPPDPPAVIRQFKETPIEREIRLSKEREEELKREKMVPSATIASKNKSRMVEKKEPANRNFKISDTSKISNIRPTKISSHKVQGDIQAELESISLKKCVSMSSLPQALKNETCKSNGPNKTPQLKNFHHAGSRHSLTNVAAPKLFTPSKGQKGLMKRFLESHGKMLPTFSVVPTPASTLPTSHLSSENIVKTVERQDSQSIQSSRRPGYISAEDKIQMELKEMKKREAELKQERARLLRRSQPNLQDLDDLDDDSYDNNDEECIKLPVMGVLRSALSNPNLCAKKPFVQKPKRRSALIDEWESRIRNEH